ncbi:predicted protein [Aspergillus nidulans FGSC A4]|nr:predicted protein [Aspergillus nidulans FGSC A4]|eukprot:XP_663901.1 predicted protein [Aspergillus nidulans FGSC A4]
MLPRLCFGFAIFVSPSGFADTNKQDWRSGGILLIHVTWIEHTSPAPNHATMCTSYSHKQQRNL